MSTAKQRGARRCGEAAMSRPGCTSNWNFWLCVDSQKKSSVISILEFRSLTVLFTWNIKYFGIKEIALHQYYKCLWERKFKNYRKSSQSLEHYLSNRYRIFFGPCHEPLWPWCNRHIFDILIQRFSGGSNESLLTECSFKTSIYGITYRLLSLEFFANKDRDSAYIC